MIPENMIAEWREQTRWATDEQVEQDLVLSRALVSMFQDLDLADMLALRGGTAIHKLHLNPAQRYSEDIDLVQIHPGPIGPLIDRVRAALDPWLGAPRREQGQGVRLTYRFESEIPPVVRLRLKIETNTREHFAVRTLLHHEYRVTSRWWSGQAQITTFALDELFGTKLRALYQRKKGRDLFDLCLALDQGISAAGIVEVFQAYLHRDSIVGTRAMMEQNLAQKENDPRFRDDLKALLPPGVSFDARKGFARVREEIVSLLPGDAWKGSV